MIRLREKPFYMIATKNAVLVRDLAMMTAGARTAWVFERGPSGLFSITTDPADSHLSMSGRKHLVNLSSDKRFLWNVTIVKE